MSFASRGRALPLLVSVLAASTASCGLLLDVDPPAQGPLADGSVSEVDGGGRARDGTIDPADGASVADAGDAGDACATVSCTPCSVCVDGACVPSFDDACTDSTGVLSVAAGKHFTCAVRQTDAASMATGLYCWGAYPGAGRTALRPERIDDRTDWVTVTAGETHVCALDAAGDAWCWGPGDVSGSGGDTDVPTWVLGGLHGIDAGPRHTCGFGSGPDELRCWGHNDYGQLGTGDLVDSVTPRQAVLDETITVVDVSCGHLHTCAVTSEQWLLCWGEAIATGFGTMGTVPMPTRIARIQLWSDVAAASAAQCALDFEGRAWCWGTTDLALAGVTLAMSPVAVLGSIMTGWRAIDAAEKTACAIDAEARVRCWGRSDTGVHGRLAMRDVFPPVTAENDPSTQISVGPEHSCAILATGELRCWGRNDSGELGFGTASDPVVLAMEVVRFPRVDGMP